MAFEHHPGLAALHAATMAEANASTIVSSSVADQQAAAQEEQAEMEAITKDIADETKMDRVRPSWMVIAENDA